MSEIWMWILVMYAIIGFWCYQWGRENGLRQSARNRVYVKWALRNLEEVEVCQDYSIPHIRCENGWKIDDAIYTLRKIKDVESMVLIKTENELRRRCKRGLKK